MFNLGQLIRQIRYNEIDCIDLSNAFIPDYTKIPEVTTFKLKYNQHSYIGDSNNWFNFTALLYNFFACVSIADKNIYICNADLKECVSILPSHDNVFQMLCLPNGKLLSLLNNHTVDIWDPIKGEYLGKLVDQAESVNHVTLLTDNCVAISSNDKVIRMWHVDTKQLIMPLLVGHTKGIQFLASFQESYLASMDLSNNLIIWYIDALEKHKLFNMEFEGDIESFLMDYNGTILVSSSKGFIYQIVPYYGSDLTKAVIKQNIIFNLINSVYTLKHLPDGKIIAHVANAKNFYYLDQVEKRILNTFGNKEFSWPYKWEVLTDGRIVTSGKDGKISLLTFPLRNIMLEDLRPLVPALKVNQSISSIKMHIHQKDEYLLNQIYSYAKIKRNIQVTYIPDN